MDELDLLKKDWNKDHRSFKKYADSDIYAMLHKKSSSIVKTLFYISLAELGFWIAVTLLPYAMSSTYTDKMSESYDEPIFMGLTILSYVVIFIFVYLLFKSHKAISTTDNAKKLMESILKTRKVIKYYVIYNLVMIFVSIPLSLYFEYKQNLSFQNQIDSFDSRQMLFMYGFTVLLTGVFLIVFWLFYKLLYGILLKRLNRNYNELKKLEI